MTHPQLVIVDEQICIEWVKVDDWAWLVRWLTHARINVGGRASYSHEENALQCAGRL